jgi:hypothetical protein
MITCPNCSCQIEVRAVAATAKNGSSAPRKDMDSIGDLLHGIELDSLNDFEREFITGVKDRYEKYHEKTSMSEKQMAVLRKIATKGF